jgi:hypothetical protein
MQCGHILCEFGIVRYESSNKVSLYAQSLKKCEFQKYLRELRMCFKTMRKLVFRNASSHKMLPHHTLLRYYYLPDFECSATTPWNISTDHQLKYAREEDPFVAIMFSTPSLQLVTRSTICGFIYPVPPYVFMAYCLIS